MTEDEAIRKLEFMQSVHYDNDVVEVYFDATCYEDSPSMSEGAQVFYRGANITDLIDWDKIDKEINWKRVKEEAQDRE
jgi:hypothetical protein